MDYNSDDRRRREEQGEPRERQDERAQQRESREQQDQRAQQRESREQQAERAQQRQFASREQSEEARQRIERLRQEIEERLQRAAQRSNGAVAFLGPSAVAAGRTVYNLRWMQSEPRRALRLDVDDARGVIEWAWLVEGAEEARNSIQDSEFEIALLDRLILALAEQESWANGRRPRVR